MTLERCNELELQCRQDLEKAKRLGDQAWIITLTNRLNSLTSLQRKLTPRPSPFSKVSIETILTAKPT